MYSFQLVCLGQIRQAQLLRRHQYSRQRIAEVVRDDGKHILASFDGLPQVAIEQGVFEGGRGPVGELLGQAEIRRRKHTV